MGGGVRNLSIPVLALGIPLFEVLQHIRSVHDWMGVSTLSMLLVIVVGALFHFYIANKKFGNTWW